MQQYLMTEEQESCVQLVRDFYTREVLPARAQYDEAGEIPMEVVRKAMDIGLHTLDIPEEYGGGRFRHRPLPNAGGVTM